MAKMIDILARERRTLAPIAIRKELSHRCGTCALSEPEGSMSTLRGQHRNLDESSSGTPLPHPSSRRQTTSSSDLPGQKLGRARRSPNSDSPDHAARKALGFAQAGERAQFLVVYRFNDRLGRQEDCHKSTRPEGTVDESSFERSRMSSRSRPSAERAGARPRACTNSRPRPDRPP